MVNNTVHLADMEHIYTCVVRHERTKEVDVRVCGYGGISRCVFGGVEHAFGQVQPGRTSVGAANGSACNIYFWGKVMSVPLGCSSSHPGYILGDVVTPVPY